MDDTNLRIALALIASITSLVVAVVAAVIGGLFARRNQNDVEGLKIALMERQDEKRARRDYVYEARKRLYHECEPLLFQLIETAEQMQSRIGNLAVNAQQGHLEPHRDGWLSSDGYYRRSEMYRFVAPITVFRLLQRRMTLVDLSLDRRISDCYSVAKVLYMSYPDDYEFAKLIPGLTYQPHLDVEEAEHEAHPERYWKQGVVAGLRDNLADSLIVREKGLPDRCMSYGEFEAAYAVEGSEVRQRFASLAYLFRDFHPRTRPVLWQMLVTQAHIYAALLRTRELRRSPEDDGAGEESGPVQVRPIAVDQRQHFDWRQDEKEASNDEVLVRPFIAAEAYLRQKLGALLG